MNKLIRQLGVAEEFSFKTITSVKELSNHDMIYCYHHLQRGSLLRLKASGINLNGDLRYAVYFRDFLLGYVALSGIAKSLFEGWSEINAEVSSLSKNKYMPIDQLDIQLGLSAVKKVG